MVNAFIGIVIEEQVFAVAQHVVKAAVLQFAHLLCPLRLVLGSFTVEILVASTLSFVLMKLQLLREEMAN